ncbi:intradiol ring-cleavage dioxygenase [Rudanella paleaurantiibacter]|uniref:Intradiol ring-cleavage dioxygenase n=1 Tax=Rudanella paleaurantiibacter TaxID=2614655 RepID=A0A7J5TVS8_9BACT|nr:intradiol ring-cleavage dioxygenase [Rudanella paleaurantiibacter]KAB7727125.1 intradiol ring-cleavage dioxygenase [Rudanella paleaurantiibacter]
MERKEFLTRGFGSLLSLSAIMPLMAACSGTEVDPAATSTSGSSTASGSTNGSSSSDCTVTSTETEGPFPTKVPANFVRKDIRDGRTGIPMTMNITIKNANASCAALAGALVDVWHCDKDGYYSEYGGTGMQSANFTTVDFLRGRQVTDANGAVGFTTIFPGWYPGRAPHIHVHIYNSAGKSLLVTQIAFPYASANTVYTTGQSYGYTKGAQDTLNERDNVFSDGFTTELATVSGSVSGGYTLTHTIVVKA